MNSRTPLFGQPGHSWPLDLDRDPCEVLGRFIQHQVVVQARERLGPKARTPEFLNELLPGHLADPDSGIYKATQRVISGSHMLTVADLLRWAHIFDVDLSELIGTGASDQTKYPPLYRAALEAPARIAPRFRQVTGIQWAEVAGAAIGRLGELSVQIGDAFIDASVLRSQLVIAMTDTGLPSDLIRASEGAIEILGTSTVEIATLSVLDADDETNFQRVLTAVTAPRGHGLALLITPAVSARLQIALAGLLELQPGEGWAVPIQAHELQPTADPLTPAIWELWTTASDANLTLVVLGNKARR